MWRPEDWDKQELETNSQIADKHGMRLGPSLAMIDAYEAGATAILAALRKMGELKRVTHVDIDYPEVSKPRTGYWVFISDDDKEEVK